MEVFDYLDAELKLADTGEKRNPPLSFLLLTFSMRGNPSLFLRLPPADINLFMLKSEAPLKEVTV